MSKRDYVAIAKAFRKYSEDAICRETLNRVAIEIALVMHKDNKEFQFGTFLTACGFKLES